MDWLGERRGDEGADRETNDPALCDKPLEPITTMIRVAFRRISGEVSDFERVEQAIQHLSRLVRDTDL